MSADKSLFAAGQPGDKANMSRTKPHHVTFAHWLAVAMVWGLAGYGLLVAPKAEARRDQIHLIACR
jgi:hypothetical protein